MKILIVDDSTAMRMLVRRALRDAGFTDLEITEASDGADGFAKVEEVDFDLILADWNMPNMTGIEMLEKLRAEGYENTVGFITTESTTPMRQRAKEAGASFLIAKPFNSDSFRQNLGPLLDA